MWFNFSRKQNTRKAPGPDNITLSCLKICVVQLTPIFCHIHPGTYARILFVDFSSVFNAVDPQILSIKLSQLSISLAVCQWIFNFLTDWKQQVRHTDITSGVRTISTGVPQGCDLSALLVSLYTNDYTSTDPAVNIFKLADNTTVRLIKDYDESVYQQEIDQLVLYCSTINLELNSQDCGDDNGL